jgi:hypothetical protein
MTTTAHGRRRIYSGATHPAPLAPIDERKRPAKRPAPPLRPSPLDRLPPRLRAKAHAVLQDFLAYARQKRRREVKPVEVAPVEILPPVAPPPTPDPQPPAKPRHPFVPRRSPQHAAEPIQRIEKILAWLKENQSGTIYQIAVGIGINNPPAISKALNDGLPGVSVVGTEVRRNGRPALLWGIKDNA